MLIIPHISYRYPGAATSTFEDITLSLSTAKVNVILGINGAGKTTLFDLITGALPSTKNYLPFQQSEVVYQTQGMYISPVITAFDFVRLISGIGGLTYSKRAEELPSFPQLDATEQKLLCRIWHMKLGTLSVGERRWLFVTAVGWLERKLYIFDEPTTAIDPSSRYKIVRKLEQLVKQSKLVIMSTHQLHELQDLDCIISLLHEGKLAFYGTYEELLHQGGSDHPDKAFDAIIAG